MLARCQAVAFRCVWGIKPSQATQFEKRLDQTLNHRDPACSPTAEFRKKKRRPKRPFFFLDQRPKEFCQKPEPQLLAKFSPEYELCTRPDFI